jgi:hypothetical protein
MLLKVRRVLAPSHHLTHGASHSVTNRRADNDAAELPPARSHLDPICA